MVSFPFNMKAENLGPHENLDFSDNLSSLKTLIYARNGQGKSFISKAFQLLETNTIEKPYDHLITFGKTQANFSMSVCQNNVNVFIKQGEIPVSTNPHFIFHVFNSEYVRQNIEKRKYKPTDKRSGYILGRTAIDLSDEKNELQNLIEDRDLYIRNTNNNIKASLKKYEKDYKLSRLSEFKNLLNLDITNPNAYNVIFNENDFEKSIKAFSKLSDIPENLADIETNININCPISFDEIKELCSKKISISSTNDDVTSFIKNNLEFVLSGLTIYENDENVCPYCKQNLSNDAKNIILEYEKFKQSEEEKSITLCNRIIQDIDMFIKNLEMIKKRANEQKKSYESIVLFFDCNDSLINVQDAEDIENMAHALKEKILTKKENLQKEIDIEKDILNFKRVIFAYNSLLSSNNELSKKLNARKNKSTNELRDIKKRIVNCIKEKLFSSAIKNTLEEKNKSIQEKQEMIRSKEEIQRSSVEGCLFECLKKNIEYFFGDRYSINRDFTLSFNDNDITECVQNVLSDGEKTILSFCYYIAEVFTKVHSDDDFEKLFFIIDDPISSLDDDYVYEIVHIIRNLKNLYNRTISHIRYIILTHNFCFMSTLCRNKIIDNVYTLSNGKIQIFKRDVLVTPYFSHLKDIYEIAHKVRIPTHTTANSLRQVVEGIKSIFAPQEKLEDFIASMGCPVLHTVANDASHGGFFFKEFSNTELIDLSKEVISYIEKSDIKKQLEYIS